ncbi:myocardin isoform X1 [Corythoichthys intestinalis]|uniref:myocardin isoform X1 n=1 Tax=Corythoichthys intestinalis TaxID=161448 RepID=UPI0025A4F773|nr:myocardin isoform X1 [Corythoichthys intestinalis]
MTLLGSEHSILIRSKFRSVLQLRLQQRRTREQPANQGIMPHSTSVGSSVEDQVRLKRGRLAEKLSEKLALRPGPLDLLQKKIIPLDSTLNTTVNHGKFPKQEDSYAFEEDSSSESLSPEQHHSDESQSSACPPSEMIGSLPSSSSSPALASTQQEGTTREPSDQSQDEVCNNHATPPIPVPAIVKSKTSDKNRHKKPKDVKPKVKKLKYHQYIPPDQKADKSPPPMDSAYARLLQQQQLFLQLQILSQQKHAQNHSQSQQHTHSLQMQGQAQQRQRGFSYQPHPPAQMQKGSSEQLSGCTPSGPSNSGDSNSSSPIKTTYPNQSTISSVKPGPLPANLDDLKVSELRQHLRIRGMPVSGTKTALIERLRPFRDSNSGSSPSGSSDITTVTFPVTPSYQSPSSSSTLSQGGYYPYPSTSSTPPISPASSEHSLSGSLPDSFSDVPMSSPPQFALQASPGRLGADDTLGGVGSRAGEGGGMEGMDTEKDKMLVEKQKVIEELTWKLHQEQRQVEELKMQLHKRKRCYGGTQGTIVPSPSHNLAMHNQTPAMMGHHPYEVNIKQEPMSLSSSCPLSSPKHIKSSPGNCMEDMGHCNTMLPNMGGDCGPQCMKPAPSSGSPSTMTAFLSPQCSPQDSPIGKPAGSPQPSSPSNPYILSTPVGRDGCGPPNHCSTGGCIMQVHHKNGSQAVNCSYPADQRGLQGVYSNTSDYSLNHNGSAKLGNPNMQPKQLTRSQQMDELLDVLIESGEMPANAREERERSSVTKVLPHITVFPGYPSLLVPRLHRHYEHQSPTQLHYDHLETLLGPMSRGGETTSLKMTTDDGRQEDEGNGDGYNSPHHQCHPHHSQQDKVGANITPLSPLNKVSSVPEVQGMVSMAFSETPWETMEWLDLTPPTSTAAFNVPTPIVPSIFNAEFLDVNDINLNSSMDLHLEHW